LPPLLTGAQKENRVTVSQELFDRSIAALLSRFGPCGLFLVSEVKSLTKRSPISDVNEIEENSTKFAPSRKTRSRTHSISGKKILGAVYQERREVL
jgi:hypothetical protein